MKKVLVLYKFLPQYRVDFFNQLKEKLYEKNIELILIYGKLKDINSKKNDEVDLSWATYRENKVIKVNRYSIIWQPSLDKIKDCDLVIVEQANKLLVNYLLMILRRFSKLKFAYWGHGANLQDNSNSLMNRFKYLYLTQCDHWFAYTNSVKRFLIDKNVSENIITVVNNAIDTRTLRQQYISCSQEQVINMKKDLGITGDNIAIYSGALYDIKKINFLIEAGKKVSENLDNFHLLIIGTGPDEYIVSNVLEKYSWLHYIGPKFDIDRVVYFKMASIFMLPGAVGLAILDAFATETPMITTNIPLHGPEIEYLKNDYNGVITDFTLEVYVNKVIYLFKNKDILEILKEGCLDSLEEYTTENMVDNFTEGILQCLEN